MFSKNQLLVSLMFSFMVLVSVLFISSLIFIISFPLLDLGFICFLFFWVTLDLVWLFEIFLVSWCRPVSLWTSLIELLLLHHIEFENLWFYFHLSQDIFWFLLWFFIDPLGLSSMLFSLPMLCFPHFSSYN